jgi:hypothetical protein
LFRNQVSLHVYPWRNRKTGEVVTADSFHAPENAAHLYRHFMTNGLIHSTPYRDLDLLKYTSRDIQRLIRDGDPEWKQYVPEVAHRTVLHLQAKS